MIEILLEQFASLFTWPTFGIMLIGILVGSLVAFLPGIGSGAGLAMLLPFALSMEPAQGIVLLLSAHAVMNTADSIMAILFGIPGQNAAQALLMDGHPLGQQGRAAQALGASFTAAGLGGLVGAASLVLAIPLVSPLIKAVGSPEMFMLSVWGVTMVGLLSGKGPLKGLAVGGLGLLIGTVGLDPQRATPRYTFGEFYFWDGIALILVGLAVFAVPQLIELITEKTLLSVSRDKVTVGYRGVVEGIVSTLRHWFLVIRSSMQGVFLGIVPGIGGSVIDWMVYGMTVQTSKDRSRFGKGDIRGVIGPDAASNSKEGGQLIPTLGFGIPGGSGMAILLGAFLALGVTPGTAMVNEKVDVTLRMASNVAVANVIATSALILLIPFIARVATFPGSVLAVIVLVFAILGAYMSTQDMMDLVVFAILGAFAYLLAQADWPRAPLLLGFVLSPLLERYLNISVNSYGASWLLRPGVLVIAALIVSSYMYLWLQGRRKGSSRREESAPTETVR